jgi:hypothetical protein
VGFVCGTWGRGIEEGRGGDSLYILGGWRRLTWSVEKNNGLVCDFNGRWLKDSIKCGR